ncbi:MAG: Hsp20/alpha crystallin family protein [Nitrosomonas sp.]|nr:Hsp20/alpha crystallin family protein [Nitrosomonas sp.]MDP1951072.1 Hsp20/alpha crystallin family protein [Nitrosomonas sp.]
MTQKPTKDKFEKGKDQLDEIRRRLGGLFGQGTATEVETSGPGLFLGGLGNLIDQVKKLSEEAERAGGEINKAGEFGAGTDKRIRGVYGFSVRTATGEKGPDMKPFGNIHKDEKSGRVVVEEIREPMTDVFDEADDIVVVAEVPGIMHEDVRLELHEDIVTFSAERGVTKYRKEILLPAAFSADKMNYACHNGILEIRFSKG